MYDKFLSALYLWDGSNCLYLLIQKTTTVANSTVAAMMSTITTADTPPMMATVSLAIAKLSVCGGVMLDGEA